MAGYFVIDIRPELKLNFIILIILLLRSAFLHIEVSNFILNVRRMEKSIYILFLYLIALTMTY